MRRRRPFLPWFWFWLWLPLAAGWLSAQTPEPVVAIAIQHIGPPAVSDAMVRSNIRVKEGDLYNRNAVDGDIQRLFSTGYFHNIRVIKEPAEGGTRLIYTLIGKPTLTRISFNGNTRFSDTKLRRKLTSKIGEPLDERKLHNDAQEILKRYQKRGFRQTKVNYVPVIDAELGRGTVTFEIEESPKVKIDDVVFVGAEAFSQRKLRGVVKTRRHWFLSWLTGGGVLKDEVFAEDRDRLTTFYREAGYIDFEVRDVEFDMKDPKWMILKFHVYEGIQYRVGQVGFDGNSLFPADEIRSRMQTRDRNRVTTGLSMGPGEIFTPAGLGRDRQGVLDFYGSRGYIDCTVSPALQPNTGQGTMDITYRIREGSMSYIERIDIRGNTHTRDRVLRRELAVSPGEVFDTVQVRLSTNRLAGLQYFSRVDAQPEATDVPDRKNLVITVEEKNTGDVRFGAGFSSIDELVGFVELTQGNADIFKPPLFFGKGAGQKLRLIAQVGTVRKDIQLSFVEPWFLGQKLALGTDFYYRELRYYSDVYDVELAGARVTLTRALWNDYWRGTVGYGIENVGIVGMPRPFNVTDPVTGEVSLVDPVSPELRSEQGYTLVSKALAGIRFDTRNSVLLPSWGQNTALEAEVAGGPLGGDADFYKLELSTSRYFPGLFPGHVLELIGKIGVVEGYGSDKRVPLLSRWYLGGLYSLRGYKYRRVAPYDSYGDEPIGGGTYWFASAEYSLPIIERLRLAAFYDIGNVYQKAYSFSTLGPEYGAYTDNWGVGVRLNIPGMGPLRLDYAIPINHDDFVSGSGRFQFSVGHTRGNY